MPDNNENNQSIGTLNLGRSRTKPFIFSGKALDFISAMLSIIVFSSILAESLYTFFDHGALVWSILAVLGIVVLVLFVLVMFYLYYGVNGLPVMQEQDQSVKFPPARLKPFDLIIIVSLLVLDAAVVSYVFNQYLNNTVYTYSLIQFVIALVALLIGIWGLIVLVKEHYIWKSKS